MWLQRVDLEGVLSFLVDVGGLDFDEPYPVEVVERLRDLVPCDTLTYQEIDLQTKRFDVVLSADHRADADVTIGPDALSDEENLYWTLGPCPIFQHRNRTGDLSAVRMSDLVDRRQYHELPIYREYFHPDGVDNAIDIGLSASPMHYRSFIFFRETRARDFSERDRAILEALRPHLYDLEARAALRRRLREVLATIDDDPEPGAWAELTSREREILALAADGETNAQIATRLWIAPSTVKKHLEHVYEKLGVGGRTAAVMRVHTRL